MGLDEIHILLMVEITPGIEFKTIWYNFTL